MRRLIKDNKPLPKQGSPEAETLLARSTFADRQWAARKAGMSTQQDRLTPGLVQIGEPSRAV